MAERRSWLARFSPSAAVDRAVAHPLQTATSAGLGLLASVFGGPVAGQAATQGLNSFFDRRNDAAFQAGMNRMMADTGRNLNTQIWGANAPSAPADAGQYTTMGDEVNSGPPVALRNERVASIPMGGSFHQGNGMQSLAASGSGARGMVGQDGKWATARGSTTPFGMTKTEYALLTNQG